MSKKKSFSLKIFFLFCSFLIATNLTAGAGDQIRIGTILPLTGNYAEYGSRVKKGVDLAIEEINSKGGIAGKIIRLYSEDSQSKAKNAVSALNKFISINGIRFVIGEVSSTHTLAMVPIAQQNQVFLFAPVSSSPKLTNISPIFARNWPADNAEASAIAEYAINQGFKSAAVLYVNVDYGIGLAENFKKTFEIKGGKIALYEGYDGETRDFKTLAAKIYKSDAQVVFLGGYHKDMAYATKGIREMAKRSIEILAGTDYEVEQVIQIAGKGAEGVIYGTPNFDPESSENSIRSFVEAYRKKYSKDPSLFEANSYDAVYLIKQLIEQVGEDPVKVGHAIREVVDFQGASGTYSFKPDGDVLREISLKTVHNGKFVPLKSIK